jgi:hypothetical protein
MLIVLVVCAAPAFFKRGSLYYILFGHCCCYCYQVKPLRGLT